MTTAFNLAASSATQGVAFRQIGALLRGRHALVAGIAASVLAGAVLELVPPLLIQRLVDEHLAVGQREGLWGLAVLYLLTTGGVQVSGLATNYLTALGAQGVLRDLRVRLFAHLQKLKMPYFDQTPLGDLISRVTADVDTLDTLFSSGVASLPADVLRLGSVIVAMVLLSPPLTLVSAIVVLPLLWLTRRFQRRVRDAERDNRHAIGRLNTHLQESLTGVEVIRAFGREASFVHRFRLALREALTAYNRATVYASLYTPLTAMLSAAAVAVLLWAGARTAPSTAGISLGTLVAFVLLFRRFFSPIINLGEEWQTIQSALSGTERIFQVLNLPLDETPRGLDTLPNADGDSGLSMGQVTFGYRQDEPVVHQLSVRVRPGEHVALVGRTGAGKTSALHLLAGLYAPWSGSVLAAGHDPRSLPDAERRRRVGVVPQAVQLFSGTVLENLTLGDPAVSRGDVERAAALTGADGFIRALPQGYETRLGHGSGAGLSAGQRQLLALTRALVWDPPVLLLDEATALIDSATETAFRVALRAGRPRAVLSIAHRLATAREADQVIVLDAGRVVEEGAPDVLIQRGGRFAALLELEAAGWDWREAPVPRATHRWNGTKP
jgi:ATP-binding cassette, subfamily B, multidrug efflux pump